MKRKSTPSTSKQAKKTVMIFGTFDHFHPGHAFLIDEARKLGSVITIVARDENVKRIKGRLPDQSEEERKTTLEEYASDMSVCLGDSSDFFAPIKEWQPDLILLGYDQKMPPNVTEQELPCEVQRATAHHPERFKSSLSRVEKKQELL